jgi:hypothetical protein
MSDAIVPGAREENANVAIVRILKHVSRENTSYPEITKRPLVRSCDPACL